MVYLIFTLIIVVFLVSCSRVQIQRQVVEIIEHTMLPNGTDVVTFRLTYWRPLLAEFNTHRVASRNSKSSRAIPIRKTLAQVWSNPYGPLHWGTNKPGMQAGAELQGWRRVLARTLWVAAGRVACGFAVIVMWMGGAKQWGNRLLEPWQSMVTVATFSNFDRGNFLELRDHPDAQPEFQLLAADMRAAYGYSYLNGMRKASGSITETDAWHLPFVTAAERLSHSVFHCIQMSVARTARASYENFDGSSATLSKDQGLYTRLVGAKPWHASPTEHQVTDNPKLADDSGYQYPKLQGNLTGTLQFRKLLEINMIDYFLNPPTESA